MFKFLPIIVGLVLGVIPTVSHHVPDAIAQFSGMAGMASPTGYILSIFVIAWIYKENWKRSFVASTLTMSTAFLTFYLSLKPLHALFYQFVYPPGYRTRLLLIQFPPEATGTIFSALLSFVQWTAIAVVVCAIAATIVRTLQDNKSKVLKFVVLTSSYAGLLGIHYNWAGRSVIGWYNVATEGGWFTPWKFAGQLFEIIIPFVLATILLSIGLRIITKGDRS